MLLVGLALASAACGKLEGQDNTPSPSEGGSEAGPGGAEAGAAGEGCAETERSASDETINARTSSMVENALPDTPVPLYIKLVELLNSNLTTKAEREAFYTPYLDELEMRLVALGATQIGQNASKAAMVASLEAQYVEQVLCWPNVANVDVDAVYYDIAVPPWTAEEAGDRECPLVDGVCPEYCVDYHAIPFDEVAGCFSGREVVVCQRSDRENNEDPPGCYEHQSNGVPILFPTLTPAAPGYLGWTPCSDPTAAMGLTCN